MPPYVIVVRPASNPELEFVAEVPDGASDETMQQIADDARARWREENVSQELTVSIQPQEWLDEGLYGTGNAPAETEAGMLARMQREAEETAGLPPDKE